MSQAVRRTKEQQALAEKLRLELVVISNRFRERAWPLPEFMIVSEEEAKAAQAWLPSGYDPYNVWYPIKCVVSPKQAFDADRKALELKD
jgi:hypothetical protein